MQATDNPNRRRRPNVTARLAKLAGISADDSTAIEFHLRRALHDPSPRVRWLALERIRDSNLRQLEPEVLAFLSSQHSFLRYTAAECLGNFHEEERIEAHFLYPLLNDHHDLVRMTALESLSQIEDKSALSLARERLQDQEPVVRSYAADAVAVLGGRLSRNALLLALQQETDDHPTAGIAAALFFLGDSDQLAVLLKVLTSSSYVARCFAANCVASLDLTPDQLSVALAAVTYSKQHYLYRADQTTMERVEQQLLEVAAAT